MTDSENPLESRGKSTLAMYDVPAMQARPGSQAGQPIERGSQDGQAPPPPHPTLTTERMGPVDHGTISSGLILCGWLFQTSFCGPGGCE